MENINEYITILEDTLVRKLKIYDSLDVLIEKQAQLAQEPKVDMDKFDATMEEKEILIQEINLIDDGFSSVYDRVRMDMLQNSTEFKEGIVRLKKLITDVANRTVDIKLKEEANKKLLEKQFSRIKKEIRKFNKGSKQSLAYYKNNHNAVMEQAYMMDKKK